MSKRTREKLEENDKSESKTSSTPLIKEDRKDTQIRHIIQEDRKDTQIRHIIQEEYPHYYEEDFVSEVRWGGIDTIE
jgi:hypothetical protein